MEEQEQAGDEGPVETYAHSGFFVFGFVACMVFS